MLKICRNKSNHPASLLAGKDLRENLLASSQSGFTLIESLLAIMMVTILLVGVAPFIGLSVAARVQAKKIDTANQAARGYIDALRSGSIAPPTNNGAHFSQTDFGVGAPTTKPTDPGTCFNPGNPSDTTCSDANTKNEAMVIQAFRDGPANTTSSTDANSPQMTGYCLVVRVYSATAFDNSNYPTQTTLSPNSFRSTASNKVSPLAVVRTEIVNQSSFANYQNRFANGTNSCTQ